MIYLVSGASRAGKSIIARKILERKGVPYFSLDWLVMGFTNGFPQYGLHDKLMPDQIAEKLWPVLEAMCACMIWSDVDYVIEGEAVLPSAARTLLDKHPGKLRVCFLGYTEVEVDDKVEEIKAHTAGDADWLTTESDDYIRDHVENMLGHSRLVKEGCAQHDLRYFDTSADFLSAIEHATRYLLDDE